MNPETLFKNPRFSAAHSIIQEAGKLALQFFHDVRSLTIEQKSNEQDLVSIADKSVEALIREQIIRSFPDDGILGEEEGLKGGASGYIWVVDPIDGTSPFLRGMREWSISVAVMKNGETEFGLIFIPCANELFYAAKNQGAFLNDKAISVDRKRVLRNGVIGIGVNSHLPYYVMPQFLLKLAETGAQFFRCGSAAITLSYVSCGRLVGYYEALINSWDCMAGLCLIREAGGWTEGFSARDPITTPMPIWAGAPQIREDLTSLILAARKEAQLSEFKA